MLSPTRGTLGDSSLTDFTSKMHLQGTHTFNIAIKIKFSKV